MVYQVITELDGAVLNQAVHEYDELKESSAESTMINIVRSGWNLRINRDYFDRVMVNGARRWVAYTFEKKMVAKLQDEMNSLVKKVLLKIQKEVEASLKQLGSDGFKPMELNLQTKEISVGEVEVTHVVSEDVAQDLIEMHHERPIEFDMTKAVKDLINVQPVPETAWEDCMTIAKAMEKTRKSRSKPFKEPKPEPVDESMNEINQIEDYD